MTTQAATTFDAEEAPTKQILCSSTLVIAAKIERLCELAIEKLLVGPDAPAILSAAEDMAEIRRLAGRVMR